MPSQHRQQPSSVDEEDKRLFRIALEGLESRPDLSLLSTIPRLDGVRLLIWIHRMEFGLLLQTPRVAGALGWLYEIMDYDTLEQIAFTQLRIKKSIKQLTFLCYVPFFSTHIASTNVNRLCVESLTAIAYTVITISLFHLHPALAISNTPPHSIDIFPADQNANHPKPYHRRHSFCNIYVLSMSTPPSPSRLRHSSFSQLVER